MNPKFISFVVDCQSSTAFSNWRDRNDSPISRDTGQGCHWRQYLQNWIKQNNLGVVVLIIYRNTPVLTFIKDNFLFSSFAMSTTDAKVQFFLSFLLQFFLFHVKQNCVLRPCNWRIFEIDNFFFFWNILVFFFSFPFSSCRVIAAHSLASGLLFIESYEWKSSHKLPSAV